MPALGTKALKMKTISLSPSPLAPILGRLLLLLLLAWGSFSCQYSKLLKSDDVEEKYQAAVDYYDQKEYGKAMGLFEQLIPILRGGPRADEVNYYYAYCHYGLEDYVMAGYHFRSYAQTYAYSDKREECEFMSAYCYYLDAPRPSLDQGTTRNAMTELSLYMTHYPQSERTQQCDALMEDLTDRLAEKSYLAAKQYFNMDYFKSAMTAIASSLEQFPFTPHREELAFLLVKSHFLYAENSVQEKQAERYQAALKQFDNFILEFPDGQYSKEARRIQEGCLKHTQTASGG